MVKNYKNVPQTVDLKLLKKFLEIKQFQELFFLQFVSFTLSKNIHYLLTSIKQFQEHFYNLLP
jgi:hypothetical protein